MKGDALWSASDRLHPVPFFRNGGDRHDVIDGKRAPGFQRQVRRDAPPADRIGPGRLREAEMKIGGDIFQSHDVDVSPVPRRAISDLSFLRPTAQWKKVRRFRVAGESGPGPNVHPAG